MDNNILELAYKKLQEMDKVLYKCMSEGMTYANQYEVANISADYVNNLKPFLEQELNINTGG